MELFRRVVFVTMLVVLTCAAFASAAQPVLHKVGGKEGWKPGVNYTAWASNEHFYVGDWLYFGYERHMYNVLEVNKTDYETCTDTHPISNASRGAGRDVFNLTEEQPYYFLSSGGYCYHGMKLSVLVEDTPPTPAPSPSKNGSPSDLANLQDILLQILLAIFFFV